MPGLLPSFEGAAMFAKAISSAAFFSGFRGDEALMLFMPSNKPICMVLTMKQELCLVMVYQLVRFKDLIILQVAGKRVYL